jgi:FkbM family methyltransferase
MKISKPKGEGWLGRKSDNSFYNYQEKEYNSAIEKVKSFRTAIDLGANLGVMSKRMVRDFQFVHAFEPLFHEHLKENVLEENIQIYPYAVGDQEKTEMMRVGVYHSGGSNIIVNPKDTRDLTEVKVVTVDSFNITDVDFIKIDVELYEMYAIKGAQKTIETYLPTVLIELTPNNPFYKEIQIFFKELGYERQVVGTHDSIFFQP